MALNIPNVSSGIDTFTKGLGAGSDVMQRMMMNPYDMQLKQAQSQNQQAEAQKSQMLANLIQRGGLDARTAIAILSGHELPDVKRQGDLNAGLQLEQGKLNLKKQEDIRDTMYKLKDAWDTTERVNSLFSKRPDLTGIGQGSLAALHLSADKDLGQAITDFGEMQANLSKDSTARPGAYSLNWAGQTKLNKFDPYAMNVGKLEETRKKIKSEYNTSKRKYESAGGTGFPSFEEFVGQQQDQGSSSANQQPGQATSQPTSADQPMVNGATGQSGANILAKTIKMPKFGSQKEFLLWYNMQPAITKHAVKIKLGGK